MRSHSLYDINKKSDHNDQLVIKMCGLYGTAQVKNAFYGSGIEFSMSLLGFYYNFM